jgi:hypothetical protein
MTGVKSRRYTNTKMIGKKINQLATELAPVSTDLTIIGDPISGVSKKITLAQLGAIFSGAVSFYTDLASFPATGDINVIYCAKDTQKLYLWSGSAYVEVFPSQALLDTYQLRSEKGNANGYASLDSQGKVPISQLPSSIMEYKGTWNASTNTPTLANGTGDTGDVYICNVAGTVNFGAGAITFAVGDYVIYSGTIWQRSSGAVGTVTSVAVSRSGDALAITGSPVTTSGTINIGFAGNSTQYINGAGNLVTFPGVINEAQNLITEVYNKTGATLTKGTVVYINGGQGNLPAVTKALATGDSTSAQTYGIVRNDITNNNNGYVVVAGRISDLDTQAYTEGTQLYLSPTTAGTFTSTKPYAPQHLVYVGIVVRAHPTQGVVEVKIQNGYELDELHNVAAQSPSNGDILQYVSSTSLWTKVAGITSNIAEGSNLYYTDARSRAALSFTAGSGAYNSTTGVITIPTNTNQLTNGANYITLASLSAGAGISYNNTTGVIASTITQYTDALARAAISLTTTGTSGAATYNSTTGVLNIPQYADQFVGTVTSVGLSSATSGVTIGSTPITTSGTITLAIATASGSQQGLLSSTDWTTFNSKQNALTNPVTGTGTTNYLPKFTGTSTIGNSIVQDDGSSVTIGGVLQSFNASPIYLFSTASTSNYEVLAIDKSSTDARIRVYKSGTGSYRNLIFETGGSTRLTLNASGNLGLGVTPSAWNVLTAMQVGNSSLSTYLTEMHLSANAYYNSGWKYVGTGFGARYSMNDAAGGAHAWFTAPSGTAGNAITFTQAMTLNASGNLSIGNTNDTYKLDVNGTGRFTGITTFGSTGGSGLRVYGGSGTNQWDVYLNSTNLRFSDNTGTGSVVFDRPISGTSATFSDLVTTTSVFRITQASVARGGLYTYNQVVGSGTDYSVGLYSEAEVFIVTGGTTTKRLTIASTGAATFSSSVTANSHIYTINGSISFGGSGSAPSTDPAIYRIGGVNDLAFAIGSSERMRITSGGLIGMGVTNPSEKLHLKDATTGYVGLRLEGTGVYAGTDWTMYASSTSPSTANDFLGFYNNSTTDGAVAGYKMSILKNGNVGIGTNLNTNGFSRLVLNGGANGNESGIQVNYGASTYGGFALTTLSAAGGGMAVYTYTGNVGSESYSERMRITSSGNVEINTGSIKTGEPDTGWGRAAIKIGAKVSGEAFNVDYYLPVSVDGTVYYINLNSSTP